MMMAPEGQGVHAMRKGNFTDEKIAFSLKQADLGTGVEEVYAIWASAAPRSISGTRST